MKSNKSTTFKYNNIDDFKIFDSLENKVIDKSQFIKNALYYYITMIEKGIIIDRNLPQDINAINNDSINQLLNIISKTNSTEKDKVIEDITEEKEEEKYEIPKDLLNVEDNDYDF